MKEQAITTIKDLEKLIKLSYKKEINQLKTLRTKGFRHVYKTDGRYIPVKRSVN